MRETSSSSSSRRFEVPVPISVTLFNLLAPNRDKSNASSAKYRSEHSTALLCPVELQIFVDGRDEPVFTSRRTGCVHPKWNHVDEMELFGDSWRLEQNNLYPSMVFRIVTAEEQQQQTVLVEFAPFPSEMHRLDPVPDALPANACIVRYSDGCYRTPPAPGVDESSSPFEDDVFDTLDAVPAQPNRERIVSVSSLLGSSTDARHASSVANESARTTSEGADVQFEQDEDEALLQDLKDEEERLLKILEVEERREALAIEASKETEVTMRNLLKEATRAIEETKEVKEQIEDCMKDVRQQEWLESLQKIRLVNDLRQIYPITVDSSGTLDKYFIRNLQLPSHVLNGRVPEDELSTALGYTSHLVILLAKYLSVPLRHRVMFNSSRSGIQECGTVYPLFVTRLVERDKVLRGVAFLHANVDCLLRHLGLERGGAHMLHKLNRVYVEFGED